MSLGFWQNLEISSCFKIDESMISVIISCSLFACTSPLLPSSTHRFPRVSSSLLFCQVVLAELDTRGNPSPSSQRMTNHCCAGRQIHDTYENLFSFKDMMCVGCFCVCVAEDSLYCGIWGSNRKFQFRQGAVRYYTELCNNLSSDYFIFKPWNSLWVTATPTMLFIIHLFVWHRVFCDMFYDY